MRRKSRLLIPLSAILLMVVSLLLDAQPGIYSVREKGEIKTSSVGIEPISAPETAYTDQSSTLPAISAEMKENEPITTGSTEPGEDVRLIGVIDGDTIRVDLNGVNEKVRLIGINTPERGQPFYQEAKTKMGELCSDGSLHMVKDVSERDRFGRLLRYIYAGDVFVNAELVRQGYAQASTYPPDVKYAELFVRLMQTSREQGYGLWKSGSE